MACLVSSLRRPRLEDTLGLGTRLNVCFLFYGDGTQEEEETLTTLGFNPPEYSNSLHRRFFVCSDQHEAKIKPEKSAAKTGEGADNFTPPKSLVNF